MAMLFISMTAIQGAQKEKSTSGKNELKVRCSPGLENLAARLAGDYKKEKETVQIQLSTLSEGDLHDKLGEGSLALLNKECVAGLEGDQYFSLVIGRDAIVPVMNANHPQKNLILEKGLSPEQFSRAYTGRANICWGEVLGLQDQTPVHSYMPGIPCALEYLSEFLGTQPADLSGLQIMDPEEMLHKIASDPSAMGFCSLNCLMDLEKAGLETQIALVPVDMDGDGRIGTFEDIYESSSTLAHGIFVGRFPRALYSRIYMLADKQPVGSVEQEFMQWLISGGQESVATAGIMALGYGERTSGMEKMTAPKPVYASVPVKASPARVYLLVAGIFLLLGLLVYVLATYTGKRALASAQILPGGDGAEGVPGGLFFDSSHTWAFMEKNGNVRIGIDHFLQQVCGSVSRVQMKQPGETVKRGDPFLTIIQNGKRLQIKSPVSGLIAEQNEDLKEDASLLNTDPFEKGWVLMIKPASWISELKSYFMGSQYADWLKKEAERLKEFFTSKLKLEEAQETALLMQDGGEVSEGVLETFGPAVWEEFQEGFIDKAK